MCFQNYSKKTPIGFKMNVLHCDGTTQVVGYMIESRNNAMQVESMDENDDIITISVPEPQWDYEIKFCTCVDLYSRDSYKIILFAPVIVRFNKND